MAEAASIGAAVTRKEDARFLSGTGRYVDDVRMPARCHAAMVRSLHAHARIVGINADDATRAPGVVSVLTGHDYQNDDFGPLVCTSLPPRMVGQATHLGHFYPIASDEVRCVGEIVAIVVGETEHDAMNAAERVEIMYEDLAPVLSIDEACREDVDPIWDQGSNVAYRAELGDRVAVDEAFKTAAHIIEHETVVPRVVACALEPRTYLGECDPRDGRLTLHTSTQSPHRVKQALAVALRRDEADIRVVARDVGGGFGSKGNLNPEEILVCWAAVRTGRPVLWKPSRSESFQSDYHGRDMTARGRLAFDDQGRITACEADLIYDHGFAVGPSGGVSPLLCARMVGGPYDIPAIACKVTGVLTDKRPTTSYRGAGRPEATFFIESLIDKAARALELTSIEIRRRNFIRPHAMPYRTGLVDTFDCGEFENLMDKALEVSDWDGFAARRAASERQGRHRGRAISTFIEVCGVFSERMEVAVDRAGKVRISAGTFSHGQGHETVFAQMVSEWLGVPIDDINLVQGDTDRVHFGRGTWGSRSICLGGSALRLATDGVIERATAIAAWALKLDLDDIQFADGLFTAKSTNETLSLAQVAAMSYGRPDLPIELGLGLEAVGYFDATPPNYPNGCHVVEVEVDPETGTTTVVRYTTIDDVGRVMNALLLDGQVHGGVAQGLGEVLGECLHYDETGQIVTGSFLDYGLPRANIIPPIVTGNHNVPTDSNPLGAKGGAETGIVGCLPATIGAIRDALEPYDIADIPLPATPDAIWRLIDHARKAPSRIHENAKA